MALHRRQFIRVIGCAAATWPLAARGQLSQRARRVGVLMNAAETDKVVQSYVAAFVQELRSLGWIQARNLQIDIRWNDGAAERARAAATNLLQLSPDVILASSTTNLSALLKQGPTMPIVFMLVSDPIAQGFVSNLARPGGNITGFTYFEVQTAGKWLDLLKQIAPNVTRVAVIFNPDTSPPSQLFSDALKGAAPSFRVEVVSQPIHATAEIEPVIDALSCQPNGALIIPTDQFIQVHRELIVQMAARYRLPAVYAREGFVEIGGLMSYYPLVVEQFRQAASYVDRILRGEKAADLPVQNPTKYELIINLKTAKALGLTVPLTLRALADEVIE